MDLIITVIGNEIKIDTKSYILLKDYEKCYNSICDAYEKRIIDIEKWKIHEQVFDVILYHINKVMNLDFELDDSKSVYFFGLPVEIIKK